MQHLQRQRERYVRRALAAPVARRPSAAACMMQMSVDTVWLSEVRQLVMSICGDALQFMRIEACQHGRRIKIWLCVSHQLASDVMAAVMRTVPGAEFGRIGTPAQGAARVLS